MNERGIEIEQQQQQIIIHQQGKIGYIDLSTRNRIVYRIFQYRRIYKKKSDNSAFTKPSAPKGKEKKSPKLIIRKKCGKTIQRKANVK